MTTIGDFAILEKSHEFDEEKKNRLNEMKQAMHLLKVPITEEELCKCLNEMHDKKFDSVEFLSMLVNFLLSKQKSLDGKTIGLVACTEGCGRSFNADSLKHHAKVCKKIFQSKRSKFNSVKARQTEEMALMASKLGKDSEKVHIASPQKKQRVPIAQMKKEFSKLQKVKDEEKVHELMLSCPEGCGRSFKSESLEKHAKVCKKVFQSKRSIFDSVKTRITDAMSSIKEKFSKDDKKSCHKDQKKKDRISIAQIKKQYYDELQSKKDQDVEVKACLECNRKFKIESLEKHAKVCKKVFQQKRAKFDSAKARLTKDMAAIATKKSEKMVSASKDQNKKKERIPMSQIKKQFLSLLHPQNDENKAPELMMKCPEGCGRTFKAEALEAHAHVCKNVFQHKRDKFDSESKRKSKDLRNFETIPYKKTKKNSRANSGDSHAEWKKQSNAFRSMVKALKAEKLRNEQPKWKTQSETLRSVVQAVHGLKKEKRVPLGTLSMNTQTDNVCCPNCGSKVNSIQKTN